MGYMPSVCLQEGTSASGYRLTWNFAIYPEVIGRVLAQFFRSHRLRADRDPATLLIGFPIAYTIAFRGGRFKNVLLLLVSSLLHRILIRTLEWRLILADNGFVLRHAQEPRAAEPRRSCAGHPAGGDLWPDLQLPAVHGAAAVRGAGEDRHAADRGSDRPLREQAPGVPARHLALAMPGVFAGSLLVFIPAVGDFINAEIIGAGNADSTMIGNVIQRLSSTRTLIRRHRHSLRVDGRCARACRHLRPASAQPADDGSRRASRSTALGAASRVPSCRCSPRSPSTSCSCPSR